MRRWALFGASFGLAVAGCGETGVNAPIAPASIAVVGATTRTGTVGRALSEAVEVRVSGTDQQPLPGVQVTFAATGTDATVAPASAETDAQGIARTVWVLSTVAGQSTLSASAGGLSVSLTATGTAGPAASMLATAGDNQTAAVGTLVASAPTVRVVDSYGNPVAGAEVTFSVLSGGGTVTDFVKTTNSQGTAALGAWVLGPSVGQQVLLARVEQGGITNIPVVFTATATAGNPSQLTALSPTGQAGTVGAAVTTPPSVRVTDAYGNPVSSRTVTFSVQLGGGQVNGATQTTNAQGVATVGSWTLGTTAGLNQLSASVAGAGGVLFSATAAAGAATQLVASAGNGQQAQISRPVGIPPTVVARDAFNNPVAGVVVTFAATAGGGTVIAPRQVTDVTGTASVGAWFLGTVPGSNTLSASAPNLNPVTFTATATAGTAVTMLPNSAIVQNGAAGVPVADPPSVVVRDVTGNPVPGVVVTFTVTAGGGTIVGSPATTDQEGRATLSSWTLGPLVITNTVVASSPGLPSVVFTASPTAGAPAAVTAFAGDDGAAVQGTALLPAPTVRVTDVHGNRVTGAIVTFAVASGGGTITGATQATDAAGMATVGSWVLGTGAPNQLTATVTGDNITGNPVVFTAHSATAIAVTSAPTTGTLDTDFSIGVRLQDSAGDAVALAGVPLTISIASGGGTLSGTTTVSTDAAGQAVFTIRVTGSAGARTFTISGVRLNSATTAAITFN